MEWSGAALCGASWLQVLYICAIPRPWNYPSCSSLIFLAHLAPSLAHSSQFFVLLARVVLLGTMPLGPHPNFHLSAFIAIHFVHRALFAIPVVPWTLSVIPVIPRTLGIIPIVPRLVPGWRRWLFLFGCLVKMLMLSFCWMLAEFLHIFFWSRRWKGVLGFVGCSERSWVF